LTDRTVPVRVARWSALAVRGRRWGSPSGFQWTPVPARGDLVGGGLVPAVRVVRVVTPGPL